MNLLFVDNAHRMLSRKSRLMGRKFLVDSFQNLLLWANKAQSHLRMMSAALCGPVAEHQFISNYP